MSLLSAVFLGLLQGLTEFFPVSSSAHLKIARMACGISETPQIFDLACHLGTLAASIWFFKRDISSLFLYERKKLSYFFFALIPLLPCYFLLSSLRTATSNPRYLGLFLMMTGVILLIGRKVRSPFKSPRLLRDAILIGTMQSAALIPGISRSASTISCAKVLGWTQKEAVRFSFLLAIPTIMGGNLLETYLLLKRGEAKLLVSLPCFAGFFAAFCAGILMIGFAIKLLEKGNLTVFALYCILLGSGTTICMFYL